jgi:hypothetical protein
MLLVFSLGAVAFNFIYAFRVDPRGLLILIFMFEDGIRLSGEEGDGKGI